MIRSLLPLALILFLPSLALAEAEDAPATEFIRVERSDTQVALQTATTRYSKNDIHVDLIGAVHIADEAYYKKLNDSFKAYPVLLFEMVGGEQLGQGRPLPVKKEGAEGASSSLSFLNTVFDTMQKVLDLSGQKDHIDYTAKNFLHADLTLKEFQTLQESRKESLLSFAIKQSLKEDPGSQPSSIGLLVALITRNPDKLKLQLIDTLGEGDNQMAAMTGENVIINDRNIKCLEVMQQQVDAGVKNIGIFYGAAHFPDMEARLQKLGFKQTQQTWIDAWVIPQQ
mgnify:CR=1 FL=1